LKVIEFVSFFFTNIFKFLGVNARHATMSKITKVFDAYFCV